MQAILLVGGLATRLMPLSAHLPKPLMPICDRELLHYQLSQLAYAGIGDVVLAAGHLLEEIRAFTAHYSGMRIRIAEERELRGTAGALANALPLLDGSPCLVLNADILSDVSIKDVLAAHAAAKRPATVVGVQVDDPSRFGLLKTRDNELHGFSEKPAGGLGNGPHFINAGVYVLDHSVIQEIPIGRSVSIERETFPGLLLKHGSLTFHKHEGLWIDIGTLQTYFQANFALLARRFTFGEDALWGQRGDCAVFKDMVYIHQSARLGLGADLYHRVVVMARCDVGANTRLENCILMPGASVGVGANASSCIIGPGAHVPAGSRVENMLLVQGEPDSPFVPVAQDILG